MSFTDLSGAFSDIGSGIGDLFAASGDRGDAAALDKAAAMEDTNVQLEKASTDIQKSAAQRDIYKTIGAQREDIAASGFQMSGSGIDLARDSASQGAITQALIADQGAINEQNFAVEAQSYRSQATAARNAASASTFGGIMGIASGVLSLFSDERLKVDLRPVGKRGALTLYSYRYRDDPTKTEWVGFVAQEVEQIDPTQVIDMGLKMIGSEYAPVKANA